MTDQAYELLLIYYTAWISILIEGQSIMIKVTSIGLGSAVLS